MKLKIIAGCSIIGLVALLVWAGIDAAQTPPKTEIPQYLKKSAVIKIEDGHIVDIIDQEESPLSEKEAEEWLNEHTEK